MIERTFKAKNPTGVVMMFLMVIYLFMFLDLFDHDRSFRNNFDYFMEYYRIFFIIFCSVVLLILLIRTFAKPFTIFLNPESISVKDKVMKPTDIKEIRVQLGRYESIIGITPVGKRLTPVALCFRIIEDEVQAMEQLTEWASIHQVKLSHKQVQKWL